MQRDARAYLRDIIDACEAIQSALADVDFATYTANRLVRSAVEREFILIGEAALGLSHLAPPVFAEVTNGRRVIDFRNQLTHQYSHVDDRVVWLIAMDDVPVLKVECAALLLRADHASE